MLLKVLEHSRCRAAFVQGEGDASRLLDLKRELSALEHLFVMDGTAASLPDTVPFLELMEKGRRLDAARLEDILESVHAQDLATIMRIIAGP